MAYTPPFSATPYAAVSPTPPRSRATAEVAVRAEWIRRLSSGCASEGGVVPARLHALRWSGPRTTGTRFAGTVGSVPFP